MTMKNFWFVHIVFIIALTNDAQADVPIFEAPEQLTFSEYDVWLTPNTWGSMMFDSGGEWIQRFKIEGS